MHKLFSLFLLLAIISCIFGISPVFAGAPDAITDLDKSKLSSDTEIYLKWTAPANNGQTITGYWIESAVETSFTNFNAYTNVTATTGSTAVTYTVTGLSEGDFLKFRVSAINSHGTAIASNQFMTGTAHGAEDHSGDIQEFSGEQNFGANSKFASSQNFKGSGNHNFVSNNMEFGADSSFNENISFGNDANFNSGIQNFSGANNFGANTIFANGQTFAVAQTFNGTNTFGDAMHFGDNQNFGGNTNTSGNLRLNGLTTGTTHWYTIIALIDEGTNGVDGHTSINATNIGGAYNAGIIYADFSAVTFGSQRNDVTFTDSNNNGVIDCTANNTCELADLSSPVTFAAGTTISFEQDPFHTFGSNTVFAAGTTFVPGQTFSSTQNFADGAMNFKDGMQFFAGQDFNQLNVDHDFSGKAMKYGTGSDFATAETFGEAGNFASGVQLFHGANAFGKDSKFAASQSFAAIQTFNGSNTFGAGTSFGAVQNFADIKVGSGNLGLAGNGTGTANIYDILRSLDSPRTTISALGFGNSYSTGIVYVDFSAVTSGNSINDVQFTDANSNGIIDCISDGACELADLSKPVAFANTATVLFDQSSVQTFGSNTAFTVGTSFAHEQVFTSTMNFTNGAMIFAPGMGFSAGQDFSEFDHNFAFDDMTYGLGSTFKTAQTFGMDANFTSGIMTFLGSNTFGKDSIFAASQTFAAIQNFTGSNTFGDAMTFFVNQDFGSMFETSGNLRLNGLTTGTTDWYTIIALIDEDDDGVDGHTSINATNSGIYDTGIIYADFSAVTSGSQINDVTFTDSNNNGVIDCTGTADDACELADLPSSVRFVAGTTISFVQDPVQDFGSNTVFGSGTTFAPNQPFTSTMDFSAGGMIFAPNMIFFPGQDFAFGGNNLNFKAMQYGTGTDFATAETFGEAGNFTSGVQLFHGANTFGIDSKFATSQTFAVPQTFAGANTFGSGTTFAASQDFSTMGIVTSASTDIDTNVLINTQVKQDAAFPDISASSGSFETGLVTITFSDVDIAKQDKIQEVLFTDANDNGIIENGELGRITDVTTSSDTMIITQAKTQDFDAGAQTFGANMKFAENQKFSEHVQTFGTGIEFSGNANFTTAQTFAASITFDDGQDLSGLTDSAALSATGMTFGSVESVDFGTNAKTFGASATFAENQNFTSSVDHNLSASDMTFKIGTLFLTNASEVFGEHVNFDGVIDFPDDQAYPNGAEFADNQSWDADKDPVFADFTTFGNATSFAEALDFKDAPNFGGTTTFVGANTFGAGTEFETGVTFTQSQTFSGAVDFGVGNLTLATQTIPNGSQFELGSTFADGQSLPLGTVLSAGLLLGNATCSGAGTDCIPSDDADILSKGEIIDAGTTIPAIKNTVTKDNPTLSIDGLGISMSFASITTDGNLDVTVKDPNDIVTDTGATFDIDGALEMTSGFDVITAISSIIDFDLTGSTANSGLMTITLPYKEANIQEGTKESQLTMLHYENGEWITEDDCTIDEAANEITCIVTSLSPFAIGGALPVVLVVV
ncbi:fibronectin type III domain-containing protein [Marine Group I thaumarchaeote]|uniref:Fibronectin type III domain-containing protein n=1 Tax=Marine Group I thaumarchaeote TaxID=2511932 RepID=A0A7K4MU45_9ARCH|nr:fibronectin type III domain-containing protein [Marine Group I thaumarchaeote]